MSENISEPVVVPIETVVPTTEPVVVPEVIPAEPVVVPTTEPVVISAEPVVIPAEPVVIPSEPVVVPTQVISEVVPETFEAPQTIEHSETDKFVTPVEPILIKSKKEMNLSEILLDFLRADSNKIEITPKLKQMIALLPLMKSSEDALSHLEIMEDLFSKIIADKQINVMDMGEIIALLKEMYIVYETMRITVTSEEVGKVFKVLVQVFIQYKLGNQMSDDEKMQIISSIYNILSLCTQMIELKENTKKLKKKMSCIPCF